MGWSFEWHERPRKDFIKERLEGWDTDHVTARLIDHSDRGARLWKVYEITWKQGERAGQTYRFISLDLIAKDKGGGWGYKDIDESMGPYYYDCPLRLLDAAMPAPEDKHGLEWRQKVREYHADQAARRRKMRSLKVGDVIDLRPGYSPPRLTVIQVTPRLLGRSDNGGRYRITPSCLAV